MYVEDKNSFLWYNFISIQSIQNFRHAQWSRAPSSPSAPPGLEAGNRLWVSLTENAPKGSFQQAPELSAPPFNQVQPLKTSETKTFDLVLSDHHCFKQQPWLQTSSQSRCVCSSVSHCLVRPKDSKSSDQVKSKLIWKTNDLLSKREVILDLHNSYCPLYQKLGLVELSAAH